MVIRSTSMGRGYGGELGNLSARVAEDVKSSWDDAAFRIERHASTPVQQVQHIDLPALLPYSPAPSRQTLPSSRSTELSCLYRLPTSGSLTESGHISQEDMRGID